MRLNSFNIDGFDYLESIAHAELVEAIDSSRSLRSYELTLARAPEAADPWLGGYSVRPEFVIRLETGGQRAHGRWRRTQFDGTQAVFVSVGDIDFSDVDEV